MKKIHLFLLLSCVFLPLSGKNFVLTEGEWYIASPEYDGKIRTGDISFRFKPDGTAELILSGKTAESRKMQRAALQKKHGREMPETKITWEVRENKLILRFTLDGKSGSQSYLIGEYPDVLLPEIKQSFLVLAQKDAKFSPEQAKQFWDTVKNASRDRFAEDLKLPEKIKLAEPEKEYPFDLNWKDAPADSFQRRVLSAINNGPKLADDAVCDIPSLTGLLASADHKSLLLQYLACHPQWRLYEEKDGSLHAVRYFCNPEGEIVPTLHPVYYSRGNGRPGSKSELNFQFRFDIGFGGKPWNGSIMYPREKTERNGNTWNTRFLCGSALVDIFERTDFSGRQMTKAALDFVENEFAQLQKNRNCWRNLLPVNSVRKGNPDLILRNGMQGGIYEGILWCNPGEKGLLYLKAFEITQGTPLSVERLKGVNAVAGWSDDPQEQFCTGFDFTIYEGEWEQFYGARFEVWFKPENGEAERKLFEKNYKIQGWQH